jgi:hypothetical protein
MANPTPIQQIIRILAETEGADQVIAALREVETRMDADVRSTERSAQAARRKEQQTGRLATKLRDLVADQARAERETREGAAQDEQATRAARRREQQIERLSRALAVEEDRQDEVNRRVRESISSHRAAAQGADENTQALGRADDAVGRMTGSVANMVTGLVGTGGLLLALRLVRAELDNIRQAQADAFGEQQTLASAQRQLKRNLVGATDEEVQQAIEGANRIASDRNVPNEVVTLAVADALSSVSGDIGLALQNVDLAAQFIPDQPDQIPVIAGGLGDIQGGIGTRDPEVALGYLLAAAGQSRITDFNRSATNIPPAVKAALAAGFTSEEAGALFSTLTTGTADRQGESSRTAAIQFSGGLKDFFEGLERPERGGAAIAALQADPNLRQAYLDQLQIEQRARETIVNLVTPGTEDASAFQSRQADFGDAATLEQAAIDKLRQLESGDLEQTANLNRILTSANEQLQAGNVGFGRVGAIRDKLTELLRSSGSSDLANKVAGLEFDLSNFEDSDEALAKLDELLEQRLLSLFLDAGPATTSQIEQAGLGDAVLKEGLRPLLNEDQLRAVEVIEQALDEINEFRGLGPENIPGKPLERLDRAERRRQQQIRTLRERQHSSLRETDDLGIDALLPSAPAAPRILNNGTMILNAGDPLFDDLDGRDRLA